MASASDEATTQPKGEAAITMLLAINHRMLDSRYGQRSEFAQRLAADDFFGIGRDGGWIDKSEFDQRLKSDQPPVEIFYDNVQVRVFDGVAIIEGVVTVASQVGGRTRIRYTDSYSWRRHGWRLIASQDTVLHAAASNAMVLRAKPVGLDWDGIDPPGDDMAVLEQLNANYVDAFRRADAGWFDAHLDADYRVTFGDGSYHDRGDALADFQIPYFEQNIRSFPVGAVRIRRFGDIALIHAENDYELKDGRKGINRYTDIWRKIGDEWKCLSAHITVFKPPV
jgi:ketosteroid isomerase-like protein